MLLVRKSDLLCLIDFSLAVLRCTYQTMCGRAPLIKAYANLSLIRTALSCNIL